MKATKFKSTELGPIPVDWEVKPFSECFTLIRNNTYARECLTDHPGSVANVHYGDVLIKYGAVLDFAKNAVPYLKSDVKPNKDMLRDGDLVFADTAEDEAVGKAVEVQGLKSRMAVAGLHTVASRPHDGLFAPRYLGYYINSSAYHNQLLSLITGTKVSSVSRAGFLSTYVVLPSLPEQKAIAEALSDVDELLEAMRTLIEKKRAIKQGAMQELLTGKKRLVGFKNSESSCLCASVLKKDAGTVEGGFNTETQRRRGTEFKMTEIGLIPEDWEVKPLSSIGIFSKGSGISRSESNSGVLPCVRYGEIYTDHNDYIKEFKSFISESVAINAKRLVDGDILFAGSGETKEEIGKAVAYLGGAERVYCGGDILVLSPFSDFDSKFLGYVCNSQAAVSQKSARGQGDAVVHIRTSNLAEVLIPIPPLPEQKAIAEVLSDMDAEIEALEAKRAKYESIKQGMMQELLTGKTRLKGV